MSGTFLTEVCGTPDSTSVETALVDIAGQTIELLQYTGVSTLSQPTRAYQAGVLHLALQVDDIDAAITLCQRHGWQAQGRPQPIPAGPRVGTLVMYVTDAQGATIELMQPPT